MTRPRPQDRLYKPKKGRKRTLNTISINEANTYALCTCGWDTSHERKKVFDRKVDAHAAAKHNNRVIYM